MDENEVVENTEVSNDTPVETNDAEPSSMLEAIQDGLKTDEPEAEVVEKSENAEEKQTETKPEEEAQPENEDEPPEGISKKAQDRFREMSHRLKESRAELESVRSDLEGIRTVMRDTGAKAEDFGRMFDYMKALNKGDMALVGEILADQVRQYTLHTGKQLTTTDPLSQFPDLRERVTNYQIDEQSALELARQRAIQNEFSRQQQAQQQQQNTAQQYNDAKQRAMQDVDQMGLQWSKNDPDYKAKEAIILKQIPVIAQNFPPTQWARQVDILYQTISQVPMQKPSAPPQVLRPTGNSGGAKQPGSMLEALQSGLGYSA